jgi:hypothetical protein
MILAGAITNTDITRGLTQGKMGRSGCSWGLVCTEEDQNVRWSASANDYAGQRDICPPDDGSRTFRAKKDDPHLLYLVRSGRWQKFGHGNWPRVRAHRSEIVQVLRARHEDVVKAEAELKTRHRNKPHPALGSTPPTFGAGGEVVPSTLPIDLADVLPIGEDVTAWFANP